MAGEAGPGTGSLVRRAPPDGPDFLCVGLQKAGTQWLYDQLQHHPDFWMPPIKELHYFDRRFPDSKVRAAARRFVDAPAKYEAGRRRNEHATVDERGAAFLRRVASFDAGDTSLEAYASLFVPKGDLLTGDVTPAYSVLDQKTIKALSRRFGHAKVCLMLREPASRLWSAWRMRCERSLVPWLTVRSFDGFRAFADRPLTIGRSYPSEIARKWSGAFGDRLGVFFLDDVITRPAETRAEILRFLGADPGAGAVVAADYNRKAKRRAAQPNAAVKALLRERFQDERVRCAELFGGPARSWPDAPY